MQVHDDLEYFRKRCSILEREDVELKNIIKKKDGKISVLELENKSLKKELISTKEKGASLEERVSELTARNRELEEEKKQLEEENRDLKSEKKNLKEENLRLKAENKELKQGLSSLKVTVRAVTARSINAKPSRRKRRYKKAGRKKGHRGKSRKKPEHIDAIVEIDQSVCSECGGNELSEKPTDSYERTVEDIIPVKVVVTKYTVVRRYCRSCKKQVSPIIPYVLPKEHFGLRLMLLIVSLKLLGLSYEKISGLFKLLFNLDMTEAAVEHAVMKVAEAFGPRYNELIHDLMKEKNIHGDETSWRINGKNHWLWAFVGKWAVIFEVDRSRGRDVPMKVLNGYDGNITSDSWPAWNYVGKTHQRCHYHYKSDIDDTIKYKNPGKEFLKFARRLKRILHDSQNADRKLRSKKKRLEEKARLEQRVEELISEDYTDKNCTRLVKRLKREKSMLFTFLAIDGIKYHNNDAERAIRPCVVIRKITYGNKSEQGARALARLMSVRETCKMRGQNFYDYALEYLNNRRRTSER
jgi:hypothetical protein